MNMSHNMARDIAAAEQAGDSALLAALARELLASAKKKTAPKPRGDVDPYLTRTERLAAGLAPLKEGKYAGGRYRWVMVEFANGFRCVTGQYPRAKDPDSLVPSIISAPARYLGILSGGRLLDAKYSRKVPRVTGARVIDDIEAEMQRLPCMRMRLALEAFVTVSP